MLRFPRAYSFVLLLAVLLPLPSAFADFYCDDQVFVLRLDGAVPAPVPGPFHLWSRGETERFEPSPLSRLA